MPFMCLMQRLPQPAAGEAFSMPPNFRLIEDEADCSLQQAAPLPTPNEPVQEDDDELTAGPTSVAKPKSAAKGSKGAKGAKSASKQKAAATQHGEQAAADANELAEGEPASRPREEHTVEEAPANEVALANLEALRALSPEASSAPTSQPPLADTRGAIGGPLADLIAGRASPATPLFSSTPQPGPSQKVSTMTLDVSFDRAGYILFLP